MPDRAPERRETAAQDHFPDAGKMIREALDWLGHTINAVQEGDFDIHDPRVEAALQRARAALKTTGEA